MAELWFQVVPRNAADRLTLHSSMSARILREEIVGRRMMLQAAPGDVGLRDDLAIMLSEVGDAAGALEEFQQSLRLAPDSAAARYNVGLALARLGRRAEARRQFESALAADPAHPLAQFQLAVILEAADERGAALPHYREAARLNPDDAEIQLAAGVALSLSGQRGEAIARLRRSLELAPDGPNAQAALAWVLSVFPGAKPEERSEAIRLAERAVDATASRNAAFLDILATSLAAAGQFDRAVVAARLALARAEAGQDSAQIQTIRAHLLLFEQRKPYHEK
jgi:tetratricopeptide (TPR) repeat protein